jgi:NAD(P)-dependent dehydrogenase (short-subunit alcohol dehydrogenase family)
VRPVAADVADPLSVHSLLETTAQSYGPPDILVNSAALDPKFDPAHAADQTNAFEDFPLEMWDQALAVNLTGLFLCSQAAGRAMLDNGRGVIINICSTYGLVGPDQRIYQRPGEPERFKPVYYSVTKAGVLGLTRYLAAYYAGKGIRVNALTPGGVFNQHDPEFLEAYSARTILGRMAERHEMNGALLFLASDASSYMTGANLVVDGGWTAW